MAFDPSAILAKLEEAEAEFDAAANPESSRVDQFRAHLSTVRDAVNYASEEE